MSYLKILPGTGRWQRAALTEGPLSARRIVEMLRTSPADPSTASRSPSPFRGGLA